MLKNSRILLFFLLCTATFAHAQTINPAKFCEQINANLSAWNKSNFKECQGTLISNNDKIKATLYKNIKAVDGSVRNEVLCYKESSTLNSISIIFYESEVFDENAGLKFRAIYDLLKACLKSYKVVQNSGTSGGMKDDDDEMPDVDFIKAGSATLNLSIEEPNLDKTFKVIITMDEAED